jgi:hypothetical protein
VDGTCFVAAGLCLAGAPVRTSYELLKTAGRVNTNDGALFAVVFVAMCVMLASSPIMCALDSWRFAVPGGVRWIGLSC